MIWALLLGHLVWSGVVAAGGRRLGRTGLLVAAVPSAATTAWALSRLGSDEPATAAVTWVAGLDLELAFRVGPFGELLTLVVSGIGTLIFVYAHGYFSPTAGRLGAFGATLVAFSASMLGLVWADSIWTLFIFWELTSVTSFLLVGYRTTDRTALAAARRALMITGGGGLVLLAGMILLANAAGTTRLSELAPVGGATAATAAVLILIGAATKSAQVPFHVWLPGAMAAPTPVSAYLHSATMVKAGVVLVAVLAPTLGDQDVWQLLGLAFGVTSVLWGGIGALRHRDAKLILAWGTVSQLGLLITLLTIGTAKATFAAIALLTAHALFKAALFLVVGEIDIRTGTRDVDTLHGLARSMPVTFAVALAAGLSMAGAPPLLGFAAKEAAIEAVLGLDGLLATIAGIAVIGGSVLTVAYTVRFLLATFSPVPAPSPPTGANSAPDDDDPEARLGEAPDVEPIEATTVRPWRPSMTVPAVILGLAGIVGYAALGAVEDLVSPAAVALDPEADVYHLIRWPGLTTAFTVSMAVLGGGALLGWALTARPLPEPRPIGADAADATLDGVLDVARAIIATVQHGSLPVYAATMATTAAVATIPFIGSFDTDHLVAWDSPFQALIAAIILAAAAAGASVGSRLGAALSLGAVGIGISGLFVVHGAPDLALTQLLVETVVVVGFVVGLGVLGRRFPPVAPAWRTVRLVVAAVGGVAVAVALVAAGADPSGRSPIEELTAQGVDDGGGDNIVNVILTDVRALDTVGEVVVLATVAVGILALARARASDGDVAHEIDPDDPTPRAMQAVPGPTS